MARTGEALFEALAKRTDEKVVAAWRAAGLTPMPPWRDALHAAFAESAGAFRGQVNSEGGR